MLSIHRAIQGGMIWTTAAMTLIAGLPHLDCRCPDGQLKHQYANLVSSNDSCCDLAAGDASRHAARHVARSSDTTQNACCCCRHHGHQAVVDRPLGTSELRKTGCHKSLVKAPPVTRNAREAVVQNVAAQLLTIASQPVFSCRPDADDESPSGEKHRRHPPPSNRILAFQHFLI